MTDQELMDMAKKAAEYAYVPYSKFPVGAALFSTWFIAVGLGWLLGVHFGMGLVGLWIGMAADECFRGLLFVLRFRAGGWQRFAEKAQGAMHA